MPSTTLRTDQRPCRPTSPIWAASLYALLLLAFPDAISAQTAFHVPYETKMTFGYDGPWNAIKVKVGNQELHLYPGSLWATEINHSLVCTSFSTCPALSDVYNFKQSSDYNKAFDQFSQKNIPPLQSTLHGIHRTTRPLIDTMHISEFMGSQQFKIANASLKLATEAYVRFPNGVVTPPDLGLFSLGAPEDAQTWGETNQYRATIPINELEALRRTPSRTWALHIGSGPLDLEGSLVFGGYDQSRLVGKATAYDFKDQPLNIELLGASIGVAKGGLPTKALKLGRRFDKQVNVNLNGSLPYMYLPEEVCKAFAESLPISLDEGLGLYLWNTSDPAYDAIVKSSAYIAFDFQSPSTSKNTIKVPLQLLNLRLDQPLRQTPTPYFPCRPLAKDEDPYLGRAFLQAAFLGMNWNQKKFWLGQAPGPAAGTSLVKPLAKDAVDLEPTASNTWEASWEGTWKITEGDDIGDPSDKKGGLSTAAVAGIAVGVAIVILGALCLLGMWYLKKSNRGGDGELLRSNASDMDSDNGRMGELPDSSVTSSVPMGSYYQNEVYKPSPYNEYSPDPVELSGGHHAAELRSTNHEPVELSADYRWPQQRS